MPTYIGREDVQRLVTEGAQLVEVLPRCQVLESDGRRPQEPRTREGPESDREEHSSPPGIAT